MTSRDSRWAGARFSSSSGKKPRGAREEGITFELLLSLNPTLIPAEIGEDPELKARCFSQLSCKLAGDVQGVRSAFGPHMNSSIPRASSQALLDRAREAAAQRASESGKPLNSVNP
eukprot:CAMPEP_0175825580 /NCGR_PEP_ID=MMETSP0107_2-20121207/11327_1 /TAXON_ID=195067 ORGANISM="Goniomonas pacifica, Strain CCMP1869" /NCGR_SAMPLE_ID=MMETSP0107_2 /ASSEMBLY_ACC=CAM_ASM_000203 /LENGTH=115 /DNA_ID=CAMNT_0017138201 /DNA_START=78 /DNA_END=425 /DNA_ORIENTATION=+